MFIFQGKLNWFSQLGLASDETVTVIIPRSTQLGDPIHMFWQWTEQGDQTNVNVHINGTIDAFLSPTQFRYCSQSDYRFEATLNDSVTNPALEVVMTSRAGDSTTSILSRKFDQKPNIHDYLYPSLPAPRIYLGKMNWYSYAKDELFLIVCPSRVDDESPVCAYWQWTKNKYGDVKRPNAIQTPFENVTNGDLGLKFSFQDPGKWYTWTCEMNEDENTLTVHMTSSQGGKADPFTLSLVDLDPGIAEKRRDSPALKNDTHDIVFCSSRSETDATGRTPSVSSLIPITLQTDSGLTQYEWAMKIATTAVASIGAADITDASELPTSQILYPWNTVTTKSSGGWLDPDSPLTIAHLHVNQKAQTLKLQVGRIPGTGSDTLMLSELFSGRSPIKMEIISSFSINTHAERKELSLAANPIFAIPGLKPAPGFPTINPRKYVGQPTVFSMSRNEDDTTLTFLSPSPWEDVKNPMFTFDPSSTYFVGPDAYAGFCYQLHNGGKYVAYPNCGVTPVAGSNIGRRLGRASNQLEALAEAVKTPGAWAYSWSGEDNSPVWAWSPSTPDSLQIDFDTSPTIATKYIYFMVHRLNEVNSNFLIERPSKN